MFQRWSNECTLPLVITDQRVKVIAKHRRQLRAGTIVERETLDSAVLSSPYGSSSKDFCSRMSLEDEPTSTSNFPGSAIQSFFCTL